MKRFLFPLAALAVLGGCVAPEEPERRPLPRPAAAAAPATGAAFEPAPVANRSLKAPTGQPILQVDGLTGKKSAPAP